jgi:hypothetical protein
MVVRSVLVTLAALLLLTVMAGLSARSPVGSVPGDAPALRPLPAVDPERSVSG